MASACFDIRGLGSVCWSWAQYLRDAVSSACLISSWSLGTRSIRLLHRFRSFRALSLCGSSMVLSVFNGGSCEFSSVASV